MKEQFNEVDCYKPNNDTYHLCVGNGSEECHDCCLYEDYEVYHSPFVE